MLVASAGRSAAAVQAAYPLATPVHHLAPRVAPEASARAVHERRGPGGVERRRLDRVLGRRLAAIYLCPGVPWRCLAPRHAPTSPPGGSYPTPSYGACPAPGSPPCATPVRAPARPGGCCRLGRGVSAGRGRWGAPGGTRPRTLAQAFVFPIRREMLRSSSFPLPRLSEEGVGQPEPSPPVNPAFSEVGAPPVL